jgi:hypothetical protein
MHAAVLGFALVFIAAIAGGGIAVPLKKRRVVDVRLRDINPAVLEW